MASCVKREICKNVKNADVPVSCIMPDGTWDRNYAKAFLVVLRFVRLYTT